MATRLLAAALRTAWRPGHLRCNNPSVGQELRSHHLDPGTEIPALMLSHAQPEHDASRVTKPDHTNRDRPGPGAWPRPNHVQALFTAAQGCMVRHREIQTQ